MQDRSPLSQRRLLQRTAGPYIESVIHLAAQAGVRHSLVDPHAYADANLIGFLNILEGCRHIECKHLIYASSSSVYGANTRMPLRTSHNTDHPLSLYGGTKKANELMAHAYASLFGLPATGLRFFTVYGPWGRPDMAMWLFTAAIMDGTPLKLFNNGRVQHDFTYIDDVTETVVRLIKRPPEPNPAWSGEAPDPATSYAPWRLYNVGNSQPVEVIKLVRLLEQAIGRPSVREFLSVQPDDAVRMCADSSDLERAVGSNFGIFGGSGFYVRLRWARSAGPTSSVATGSGCVSSHNARAVTVGSTPTFLHHAVSSPQR